jgi:uncharacterized protein YqjF (DUF2071 family)
MDAASPREVKRTTLPVVGYQRWHEILFLHWEVAPHAIRSRVDPRLELDLFDGRAYVSLTPFTMRGARLRALPPLPTLTNFHELNLRTYVRRAGVPGLWFFSLDAASTPAAAIARVTLGLPYFRARMARTVAGPIHDYRSDRLTPGTRPASFAARWSVRAEAPAPEGSLDRFLAERYALYTTLARRLLRVRVRHAPWELHDVRMERLDETVTRASGIEVGGAAPLAHFSRGVDVEVFPPEPV